MNLGSDMMQVSLEPDPDISFVIPCYNEEDSLDELVRRVENACKSVSPLTYERAYPVEADTHQM
jgi:cellulose synthase/poly-beta-1,6-N-acetylglucosamine synthase-like glycosyltransferase